MSASNPIRWSYDTLVESFEVYHAGTDPPRKLLDFAQQLSVFEPEKKAVAKKAKVEKAAKPSAEETAEVVKEVPQRPRVARAPRAPRARHGPVPQPFAAPELQPAPPEDEQEHLTPEQYSDWMKYYRECAEYFEQCERNCAEQAGMELPRRADIGQAPSAPAAPAREAQAPSIPSPFHAAGKAPLDSALSGSPWASLMPPPLPEGVAAQAPLLQALQALQLLQQQQQLQQLQIQSVQQLISGSLLGGGLLGLAGAGSLQSLQNPALSGLNSETLMNLLMAWYYSGYYTGEYAARQGKM